MKIIKYIFGFSFVLLLFSCASSKNYNPQKKYPAQQLQKDYTLLRNILEQKHPSLYWYTPKDSMDMYFDTYYNTIKDSMTEQQFGWKVIAPLTEKIRCGHTSFGMSKAYNKWVAENKLPSFPLFLKCWNDTMVVTANLNRKDSVLKRGTLITSINGVKNAALTKTMFEYLTEDGYANNVNYIRLSGNFPYYHRNIFGVSKNYDITYIDSTGVEQRITVPVFDLSKDSSRKTKTGRPVKKIKKDKKESRQKKLLEHRSLAIDTVNSAAIITLNTFSAGGLRKFYRQTFRYIKIPVSIMWYLMFAAMAAEKSGYQLYLQNTLSRVNFKVADTSYAVTKSLKPYAKYVKESFVNNLGLLTFYEKKKKDGHYHFGHWERNYINPKPQISIWVTYMYLPTDEHFRLLPYSAML